MPKNTNNYYDELKEEIRTFFSINSQRPFTLSDLHNHYDVYQKKQKMLYNMLVEELVQEGKLYEVGRGKYTINPEATAIVGKVDHINSRFAFIRHDPSKPDVWISEDDLNGAIDGDTVKVTTYGDAYRRGGNPEGRVIEIVARGREEIVGKIQVFGNYALVRPDHKNLHEDFFVPKDKINGATKDDLVILKIMQYPTGVQQGVGEIIEILGKAGDNNAEMHAIMAEFGLPVKFPKEVEAEAEAISEVISEQEIQKRRDFRNILTFTIDPFDAKDFDDALSFQVLPNGNYEIGVHIADVSHYVREGSLLEAEAFRRATSVYLVDRTIPMLPEKLSNALCSLRPNEDKLTFAAVFEMNQQAEVLSQWFGRTVIHSDKRFAYEDAQVLIENEAQSEDKMVGVLQTLNNLALILREERFKKGAINFETTEVKFQLDEKGKPIGLMVKVRKDAHKLIEEFMLLANKKVAEFVYSRQKPHPTMVYRIHEAPDPTKIQTFSRFASRLGFSVKTENNQVLSNSLNKLMSEIEGTPVQNVLEQLAVRTMSKARYSTEAIGHFGLAFEHYSHFTSPIRRYPDVMAHRLLQHYLDKQKSPDSVPFEEKCKHSSDRERAATEAERASIKYKQVEFMSLQTDRNKIYDGVITGVTDFGIFVEITETSCEGMIRLADMDDDFYELDAENYRVIGKRKGKIITFGDSVKVKVKSTDLERRSMDLLLASVETKNISIKKRGEGRPTKSKSRVSSKDKGKRRRKS